MQLSSLKRANPILRKQEIQINKYHRIISSMHPEISPCVACNRNHLSFIRCIILLKTKLPRPCLVDINPRKSGGFRSTYKQRSDQLARIIGCQSSSQCQPPRGDPERFSLASSSIRTYESPKDTGYIDTKLKSWWDSTYDRRKDSLIDSDLETCRTENDVLSNEPTRLR